MKTLFVGIDFSKRYMDASMVDALHLNSPLYHRFSNDREGCRALLRWLKSSTTVPTSSWLVCGEHTGLHGLLLAEYLVGRGVFFWMEAPLQIKHSLGIKREKNDRIDSRDIALYAYRFQDRARAFTLPPEELKGLKLLQAYRDRLVKAKNILLVPAKELKGLFQHDSTAELIVGNTQEQVKQLDQKIKEVEAEMMALIKRNESIHENFKLVTSIVGVGLINATAMLVHTNNFTRFATSRELACYVGVVPFEKSSGSSIRSKPRVSPLANRQMKVLLTQAANSAIIHNAEIKDYYNRKIAEGKHPNVVKNNVRNKLVQRICAVVKRKAPFQDVFVTNAA